jgi:hypothetical protein
MEDELLRLAGKQVDRRKDDLERWVRVNFDNVYDNLMKLSLERNKLEDWQGYEYGRELKAEKINEARDCIPSEVISEAIGFFESQIAFLSSISLYRDFLDTFII